MNGQGPDSKWDVWYPVDKEAQKSRSSSNMVPTQAMFDKMRDDAVRAAERAVEERYEKSNKVMFEAFKTWMSTGQSQDFSYEQFAAMIKPPATASTRHSSPSVSFMGNASLRADIDALTVSLNKSLFFIHPQG